MATELDPREHQDLPVDERAEELAEEAAEPESVEIEEHTLPPELRAILDAENILETLDEATVTDVQYRVTQGYDLDRKSMDDYLDRYEKIIQIATMRDDMGDKTFPFVGASKVMQPMLAQAAIEFNSRTVPEVVNRQDVAHIKLWGKPKADKAAKAERRALAINWQLKKGIDRWPQNTDRAMLLLPVVGMYFRKKWWSDGRICESLITADKMIYNHDADSFNDAPRKSHWFFCDRNDYESYVRSGYYAPIPAHDTDGKDKQPRIEADIKLIESHCTLDLDHDGYCEPYIVTFCECCDTVVKIERRFHERDVTYYDGKVVSIKGEEFFTQAGFIPNLEKAAVYDGWGQLLFDMFESMNTMLRQMIDAGTLNNTAMNSGFISSNIKAPGRTKSARVELILGQLTKVDTGSGTSLKDMIWTPQFQGVSQSFYQMYQDLREEVMQYITASQSLDVAAGEAASLYLARLQQALRVPNAIASRVYQSLSDEFKRIDTLMRLYMGEAEYKSIIDWQPEVPEDVKAQYAQAMQMWEQNGKAMGMPPPDDPQAVADATVSKAGDFEEDFSIITTADPSMGSEQERIARAEMIVQRAENMPAYNRYECEKNYLKAIGETEIDKLLPMPSNEPAPAEKAQLEWTLADTARMKAAAMKTLSDVQARERELKMAEDKLPVEIDKATSETLKNLNQIDQNEAKLAMDTMNMARDEVQMNLDAQGQLTQRQAYKVMDHPEHGEITEADIQKTMADNGMTRDQVIAGLQEGQDSGTDQA